MAIKYDIDNLEEIQELEITKEFTNRESAKHIFRENLSLLKASCSNTIGKHFVINYYGIGGIGKSELLFHLIDILDIEHKDVCHIKIDFSKLSNFDPIMLLFEMYLALLKNGIELSEFSFAYSVYQKMINPNLRPVDIPELMGEIEGVSIDIITQILNLPVVSTLPTLINKAYAQYQTDWRIKKQTKQAVADLFDMYENNRLNRNQLHKFIANIFVKDLTKKINESPLVIFFDTYDLVHTSKEDYHDFNDDFIEELVFQLPNVLFVICGREKLCWKKYNSEQNDMIVEKKLAEFSKEHSVYFMSSCNITDENIQNRMMEISSGHPFYLNMLVNIYHDMKRNNLEVSSDSFPETSTDIVECFFKYRRKEEKEVIKLLSIVNHYNYDVLKHLINEYNVSFSTLQFSQFNKYSFVKQIDEETFELHKIMRSQIPIIIETDSIKAMHRTMLNYYEKRFEQECNYSERKRYLNECVYHAKKTMTDKEFLNWLVDYCLEFFMELQIKGEVIYLLNILDNVCCNVSLRMDSRIFNIYVDMVMLKGEFRKSVELISEYLALVEEDIYKEKNLLMLLVKSYHHSMIYSNTTVLLNKVEYTIKKIGNSEFQNEKYEAIFIKINLLMLQGNLEEALFIITEFKKEVEYNDKADFLCRVYRKEIDVLLMLNKQERFDVSKKLKEAEKTFSNHSFQRYHLYFSCTKAEYQRLTGYDDEARKNYNNCKKQFKNLEIKPWVAHCNLGLALIMLKKNECINAEVLLDESKDIYTSLNHEWGMIQTDILKLKLNIIQNFDNRKETLDALSIKCEHLGYLAEVREIEEIRKGNIGECNLLFL